MWHILRAHDAVLVAFTTSTRRFRSSLFFLEVILFISREMWLSTIPIHLCSFGGCVCWYLMHAYDSLRQNPYSTWEINCHKQSVVSFSESHPYPLWSVPCADSLSGERTFSRKCRVLLLFFLYRKVWCGTQWYFIDAIITEEWAVILKFYRQHVSFSKNRISDNFAKV